MSVYRVCVECEWGGDVHLYGDTWACPNCDEQYVEWDEDDE